MKVIEEIEAALGTELIGSDAEMLYRDILQSAVAALTDATQQLAERERKTWDACWEFTNSGAVQDAIDRIVGLSDEWKRLDKIRADGLAAYQRQQQEMP